MEPIRVSNSAASSRLAWAIRNATSREAQIDLFDVIGDPYEGTTAKDFIQELRGISASTIHLNINSPGGYVDDALAIHAALQAHPAEIIAHITVAASAASFVAQAADIRLITKNGKIQIHDGQAPVVLMGHLNALAIDDLITRLDQVKAALEEESNNIATMYSDRAGGTPEDWRRRMKANGVDGTLYRGQDAVDIGLADEVIAAPVQARPERPAVAATVRVAVEPIDPSPASDPIEIDPSLIPSLANGYKPPLPADLTRLVAANLPASTKGA